MKTIKNKILILTATHGNEEFSIPVVEKLSKKFDFDWKISNPKALKLRQRFFEKDLNRSGPGNLNGKLYEERRAKKVINIARTYKITIDLHGTISSTGCFLILSDPNWQNIELAKKFNVKNVVLWPSLMSTGPLTQFIPNSLEIECGPKDSPETADKLNKILNDFLSGKDGAKKQNFYIVTGKFVKKPKKKMKEFKKFSYKKETFYPLMVGQYPGITCYMMQRLNDTL